MDRGKSTAVGGRGPGGTLERDVNFVMARALQRSLGAAAQLTRGAHENPSLAERAAVARRSGALFVSLHANAGPALARGPEVWIHDRAAAPSIGLAQSIARALGGPLYRADLAVLAPDAVGGGAARLVEVDYLSNPAGEHALRSGAVQARTAHAIARAIVEYDRPARYGLVPATVDQDGVGLLWTPRWAPDWEVGFVDGNGVAHVGVVDNQPGDALALANVGVLFTASRPHGDSILLVEEVALTPSAAGGAAAGFTRFDLRTTGRRAGWTWIDHEPVLELDARRKLQPISATAVVPSLTAKLDERARIELLDDRLWIWMSFSLSDEAADVARWVPPGHPRSDVDVSSVEIDAEIARMPAAPLQAKVTAYRNILVGVAVHEGSFGSVAGAGDTHASLGIFQWAMEKNQTAESGSLGMFFRDLANRAAAASAPPTAEEQLFIDAQSQCTAEGLSVVGNQLHLNGVAANGQQVQAAMRTAMSVGALRTYQLVAAVDWIDRFRTTAIRPGPSVGRRLVGNGYTQSDGPGLRCTLTFGGSQFEIDATMHRTIGDLMISTKALTNAITLGVNRPHFVEAAAWKVLSTGTPGGITDLLRDLTAELTNSGATRLPPIVTRATVQASTAMAKLWFDMLERAVWPIGLPSPDDEWRTVADFRRHALKFYDPGDARTFHRERRFSTLELLPW